MKTNLKLRHQMENEDRSNKWLGAKNNDQQCGSKTGHLEEIWSYVKGKVIPLQARYGLEGG